MAYPNGYQKSRDETQMPNYASPMRTISNQHGQHVPTSSAERAALHRRFTTNTMNTVPTLSSIQSPLSPIGQQRRLAAEQHDFTSNNQQSLQSQAQREHAERLKASSLRARQEAERLEEEYRKYTGQPSEPATPPDAQETMVPKSSTAGRTNRFSLNGPLQSLSAASLQRGNLSGAHKFGHFPISGTHTPAQGQTTSYLNSDAEEDDDDYPAHLPSVNRRAAVRNSMPVTNFDYRGMSQLPDVASVLGINSLLLDDDDFDVPANRSNRNSAAIDHNSLLHVEHDENEFPMLLRRTQGDAARPYQATNTSMAGDSNNIATGWSAYQRHRSQKSLPMNNLRGADDNTPSAVSHSRNSSVYDNRQGSANNRHSVEMSLNTQLPSSNRSSVHMSPLAAPMPNLRSSLSTNDIPTINSLGMSEGQPATSAMTHEQRLHNHNANLGRIPAAAVSGHRREASIGNNRSYAAPSGIAASATYLPTTANHTSYSSPPTAPAYANNMNSTHRSPPPQMAYGLQQHSQVGHQAWTNPAMATANYNANYNPYYYQQQQQQQPYSNQRGRDSQQWIMAQRRGNRPTEEMARTDNRFVNSPIEDHIGKIFEVSKDQNGCRYLQKKIEEDKAKNLPLVFGETQLHIVELMKDPFGNYLCQKLLENCNTEQRTILINNAAPSMVDIAINQHGTRALQKMIEHISTPEQVDVIVRALGQQVVTLIQDLNGNHVIQKCLNHLRPDNAQFIFDAVGTNAYLVGTHRHGCCVLQRCIDHATGQQQEKLISEITGNAFRLMQDAYGNYVIQYILDLNEHKFTGPLCATFSGHVVELSRQKFSSNVIEKSMRMADAHWQRQMVHEITLDPSQMEGLLRDPFANYVVQTAIEHGPQDVQARLWEVIKPTLPNIRGTPCGRRLSQKLAQREGNRSGQTSGSMTPQEGIYASNGMNTHAPAFGAQASHYNGGSNNNSVPGGVYPSAHAVASGPRYGGQMYGGVAAQGAQMYPQAHQNGFQGQARNGQYPQHPAGFF